MVFSMNVFKNKKRWKIKKNVKKRKKNVPRVKKHKTFFTSMNDTVLACTVEGPGFESWLGHLSRVDMSISLGGHGYVAML